MVHTSDPGSHKVPRPARGARPGTRSAGGGWGAGSPSGSRICQIVVIAASVALALGSFSLGPPVDRAAAEDVATPATNPVPLYVLASGEGPLTPGSAMVWVVQHGAVSGARHMETSAFPLGFVLARRGALDILDGDGVRVAELEPGRAGFLPVEMTGSYASASGDLALFGQIALVPHASLPATLPSQMVASEPFAVPGADTIRVELLRGLLNPGRMAAVPAAGPPALLIALDNTMTIHLETAGAEPAVIARDEIVLLTAAATVRNHGTQPATFVVARIIPSPAAPELTLRTEASALTAQLLAPELDDAWRRLGCHLNPGNPSCVTVGVAADCALDPADPGCGVDSDGDSCRDVAEVRAGFDPFDAADCVSGGQGEPAVNCLFRTEDIACAGGHDSDIAGDENGCVAAREIRLRRNPSSLFGCGDPVTPPPSDCPLFDRDPRCDGFAPGETEGHRVIG